MRFIDLTVDFIIGQQFFVGAAGVYSAVIHYNDLVGVHHDEPVGAPALRERGFREAMADAGVPVDPSSAVGGHSGGSERASMLVNAIRWFRNG